eukprot:TRINITY_DN20993_c0_g1_i1.p1 TRINITY_DN20993_c0_g1~~TRINITY_DN20993_c0_g1_i1.p1  ORF type:complete len:539 (-),score=85.40 TRINITY_DN20993_c0_g1_i1:101-1696(-)
MSNGTAPSDEGGPGLATLRLGEGAEYPLQEERTTGSYTALLGETTGLRKETTGNVGKTLDHIAEDTKAPLASGYTMLTQLDSPRDSAQSSYGGSDGRRPLSRYDLALKYEVSLEEYHMKVASAKLVGGLRFMDMGKVSIEAGSVYGAAVLMPQVARTAGWARSLLPHVVSSYFYLMVTFVLHAALLMYVCKEEHVLDLYAGQMYLCDFGAHMEYCNEYVEKPGVEIPGVCLGPSGSKMTSARLYSWSQWTTRNYFAQVLGDLFPEKGKEIRTMADPGEYGVESYWCRLLCCFVFVISIIEELGNITTMMRLLWYSKSENEPWFELATEGEEETIDSMDTWCDQVKLKIAGMSRIWKLVNVVLILIPKAILWEVTASAGVNFLMETAGINDIIVNSVALGFLLTIDEVITGAMMSEQVNHLLSMVEDMPLYDPSELNIHNDEETMQIVQEREPSTLAFVFDIVPRTMVLATGLTAVFVYRYYCTHCDWADGHFVSKEMRVPKSMTYSFFNAVSSWLFPIDLVSEPYWSMPVP